MTHEPESVFTYGSPNLKIGRGAADEIGYDLPQLGARRVLVVTDASGSRQVRARYQLGEVVGGGS